MMLSVGVTWLRRETGRQWHLAVINEVTFPTALAEIWKNLFHFKVTSGEDGWLEHPYTLHPNATHHTQATFTIWAGQRRRWKTPEISST